MRLMFPSSSFQNVGPLKSIRTENPHIPSVTSLRANDEYPPISGPIRKHVLDNSHDIPLHLGITRVVHLDGHCHTGNSTPARMWRYQLSRGSGSDHSSRTRCKDHENEYAGTYEWCNRTKSDTESTTSRAQLLSVESVSKQSCAAEFEEIDFCFSNSSRTE